MTRQSEDRPKADAMQKAGGAASQMTGLTRRLNAIGENPLKRREAERLRRAYAAAAVRFFDGR
jgi:hypothetical protein